MLDSDPLQLVWVVGLRLHSTDSHKVTSFFSSEDPNTPNPFL